MSATNFRPNGSSVLCNVSTTSTTVQVTATSGLNNAWLVVNAGTTDAFFRISSNAAITATVPVTSGTGSPGQLINSGDAYIVGTPVADGSGDAQFIGPVYVAANCATLGTSTQLFINPVTFI